MARHRVTLAEFYGTSESRWSGVVYALLAVVAVFLLATAGCSTAEQEADCLRTCEALPAECYPSRVLGDDICICRCYVKLPPHVRNARAATTDGGAK